MIISMQFFPSFCVFLLSPDASQPGVFRLMAIITDELMIPELAAATPLLLCSLCPAGWLLSPWSPGKAQPEGDKSLPRVCFSCLLPECKFPEPEWFPHPLVCQSPALRWCHPWENGWGSSMLWYFQPAVLWLNLCQMFPGTVSSIYFPLN